VDRRRGPEGRGRAEPGRRHRHLHAHRSRPRDLRHRPHAKPAAKPKAIRVRLSGKATRAAFAKGLTLKVGATGAGRIDASAGIAKKVARKLRLSGGAWAARIATRGFAAAPAVTVARGHAKAKRAGTVKIRLKPTKAAKRAAKRMRKVVLTVKVSQPGAAGKATVRLR